MVLALLQNLVRKTQNLARLLEDFTSTFHNIAVPYSIALPQNLVRKTQNLARFLEDFTSTFHNTEVPYSIAHRGFCIKKTLCLFSNDSFRYAHLRFAQMSLLHSKLTFVHSRCKRSSLRSQCWMRLFLWFLNTVSEWKTSLQLLQKKGPLVYYQYSWVCKSLLLHSILFLGSTAAEGVAKGWG